MQSCYSAAADLAAAGSTIPIPTSSEELTEDSIIEMGKSSVAYASDLVPDQYNSPSPPTPGPQVRSIAGIFSVARKVLGVVKIWGALISAAHCG